MPPPTNDGCLGFVWYCKWRVKRTHSSMAVTGLVVLPLLWVVAGVIGIVLGLVLPEPVLTTDCGSSSCTVTTFAFVWPRPEDPTTQVQVRWQLHNVTGEAAGCWGVQVWDYPGTGRDAVDFALRLADEFPVGHWRPDCHWANLLLVDSSKEPSGVAKYLVFDSPDNAWCPIPAERDRIAQHHLWQQGSLATVSVLSVAIMALCAWLAKGYCQWDGVWLPAAPATSL